jgi:hypothetical protein
MSATLASPSPFPSPRIGAATAVVNRHAVKKAIEMRFIVSFWHGKGNKQLKNDNLFSLKSGSLETRSLPRRGP